MSNYSSFLPIFISYSMIVGLIGYFLIDFITAKGNLRRKIRFVKLLVLYFIFLIIMNRYLIFSFKLDFFTSEIQLVSTALIAVLIIISDNLPILGSDYSGNDFDFVPEIKQLPQKYLRPRPFQTVLETIFRLFPLPEPVALYRVGEPDDMSPVIVTGNYELKLTQLSKYVSHKRLILPQLCAPGVDIKGIRQKTGLTAVFGPVYIEHIKEFLDESGDESRMRRVEFGILQRIEMAIGSPIILTAVLTFVYLFFDISKLLFVLPAVYFLSVVHAVIYPHRPVRRIPLWSLLYSSGITVMIAALLIFTQPFNPGWLIGITATIGVGIFYLINEFEGWSPLVKYNLKSIYTGVSIPEIRIDGELCIGCRLCFILTGGRKENARVFIVECRIA